MATKKKMGGIFIIFAILLFVLSACSAKTKPTSTPTPEPTRDPVLESTFVSQLQTLNPDAVPVYQQATTAMDANKLDEAMKLYEKVILMAPNFSVAHRRLGTLEAENKDITDAIAQLRLAVSLEPNGYNQSALANVLLATNIPVDAQEAYNLSVEAAKSLPKDEQVVTIWLLSALASNNLNEVPQINEKLLAINPLNPLGVYNAGLIDAQDGKWEQAEKEIQYSQQLGMPAELVNKALDSDISRNALLIRLLRWSLIAFACWLLGLGILFLVGSLLSKFTFRALNAPSALGNMQARPEELGIRAIYRGVITLLSLYFYVSIPFVILLLFLVVGGAFYIFFLIGRFPIYWCLILAAMLITSLIAIARSIFSKSKNIAPGQPLNKIDAPELWNLVEGVAKKLNVRPVEAIYVTPGTEIGVYEQGGIMKKIRGTGTRSLLLGMGVLSSLTQAQFAAILAHEYGHFSNKDTAGGNLAHQVYISLRQMAQRLIWSKANQVINPVWLFVMAYERIYLYVTQGASRLQEILADRYAAAAFGGENFIQGLQNVIKQQIAFSLSAQLEINHSLKAKLPIINVYDLPLSDNLSSEINRRFDAAMKRSTTKFDSHPAPQERISMIENLRLPYSPIQENLHPVLDLFPNLENLQRKMTEEILSNIKK